jgi:F-type H+-transporting ATPase subunit gamma
MASVQQLKSRIRSVNSTKQITKAMQLVSASKMRRATQAVKETSDYANAARELLADLAHDGEVIANHPLFAQREVKSRLIIVMTSDQGLAGAYNANALKQLTNELREDAKHHIKTQILAIGRKAAQFLARVKLTDVTVIGAYEKLPDQPSGIEIHTILNTMIEKFESGEVDAVDIIYTQFFSAIRQTVVTSRALPAGLNGSHDLDDLTNGTVVSDSVFEPSRAAVLSAVAERLVETHLVQALLDARASEHSTRMMAMKNATDNATSLSDDLTLEMNKERQAAITQEISEIANGAEAIE